MMIHVLAAMAAAVRGAVGTPTAMQEAQAALHAATQAVARAQEVEAAARARLHQLQAQTSGVGLPNGTYRESCTNCTMYDQTLACLCKAGRQTAVDNASATMVATSIRPRSTCANPDNISTNAHGYLSCQWRDAPPPRVGNLTRGGADDIHLTCRILHDITFMAPQYSRDGAVLSAHPIGNTSAGHQAQRCCDLCTAYNRRRDGSGSGSADNNSTTCRAWTIMGRRWVDPSSSSNFAINGSMAVCYLIETATTAYPASAGMGQWGPQASNVISGFPLASDAGSYCPALWIDGTSLPYGDEEMAAGVSCATLAGKGSDDQPVSFPRKWAGYRGNAWFFLPPEEKEEEEEGGLRQRTSSAGHSRAGAAGRTGSGLGAAGRRRVLPQCNCKCDGSPGCWSATCSGPTMNATMAAEHIRGRPWIVFIHGGEFHVCSSARASFLHSTGSLDVTGDLIWPMLNFVIRTGPASALTTRCLPPKWRKHRGSAFYRWITEVWPLHRQSAIRGRSWIRSRRYSGCICRVPPSFSCWATPAEGFRSCRRCCT
jgi:hypothetical protein